MAHKLIDGKSGAQVISASHSGSVPVRHLDAVELGK